jgi:hypothetical protein
LAQYFEPFQIVQTQREYLLKKISSAGLGAIEGLDKGVGGACSTHYSSRSKSATRIRHNKIYENYSTDHT